ISHNANWLVQGRKIDDGSRILSVHRKREDRSICQESPSRTHGLDPVPISEWLACLKARVRSPAAQEIGVAGFGARAHEGNTATTLEKGIPVVFCKLIQRPKRIQFESI